MALRFVHNDEYGAANLVALVLQYREKHGEIDDRLLALAGAIDEKIAQLKNELLGGAGSAFDTFKELQDLFLENKDLIEELKTIAGKHVRFDIAQSLTNPEKTLARSNIGAVSQSDVDSAIALAIPSAPTASVSKVGATATITIKDASGTTTASISDGLTGPYYQPVLDNEGNISWTNNGGLANPATKNIRGPQGPQGIQGIQGEKGETGDKGATGERGPQGFTFKPVISSSGVLSWTNDGGLANPTAISVVGPKGADGAKGDTGPQGPQGPTGATGEQGPQGPRGVTFTPSLSSSGVLSWTNDGGLANPSVTNLKGPKGDPGSTGATGPQGPEGDQGPKGDTGSSGVYVGNGVMPEGFNVQVDIVGDEVLNMETWTFTLEDGSVIEKQVLAK